MAVSRMIIAFQLFTPILAPRRQNVWLLERWLAGAAAWERFPRTMTGRYPGMPDWIPMDAFDLPLARDTRHGCYQTTQAFFPYGGRLTADYRSKPALTAVATGTNFASSGIFKAWHVIQPLWEIPVIAFVADVTDPDRLFALLDILEDNGLGGDRHRGYGHITAIDLYQPDHSPIPIPPLSVNSAAWDTADLPTRPLPWHNLTALEQAHCTDALYAGQLQLIPQRLVAPAWAAQHQTLCVLPATAWPEPLDASDDSTDNETMAPTGSVKT